MNLPSNALGLLFSLSRLLSNKRFQDISFYLDLVQFRWRKAAFLEDRLETETTRGQDSARQSTRISASYRLDSFSRYPSVPLASFSITRM